MTSNYSIPALADIRTAEPNGFTVASTFAGGGGSSTGYRMDGFRVAYANEFVEAARDTYGANMRPGTILDGRDIREVSAEAYLDDHKAAAGVPLEARAAKTRALRGAMFPAELAALVSDLEIAGWESPAVLFKLPGWALVAAVAE